MLQRITFVGTMIVDIPEKMTFTGARRNVKQALAEACNGKDFGLHYGRLLKLELVEEEGS